MICEDVSGRRLEVLPTLHPTRLIIEPAEVCEKQCVEAVEETPVRSVRSSGAWVAVPVCGSVATEREALRGGGRRRGGEKKRKESCPLSLDGHIFDGHTVR